MAKEAEMNAEEDKKKREAIDAKNGLDNAVYQAEKMKTDYKDKISEDDVKTLDEAIEEAKKVVSDDKADKDTIEAAAKALSEKIMPIGAKMYENVASDDKSEVSDDTTASSGSSDDEPEEGEVVDEDKKED